MNFITLKTLLKHPLISGSSIVFIGSFGSSILAYLFNLTMIRLLSVSDYGLLTALSSLTVLFGIFQMSLIGIFAKFSAKYKAGKDELGFAQLYSSGLKFVFLVASIISLILFLSIPLFSYILKISEVSLLVIIIFSIAISIVSAFPLGILQGEMRFWLTSILYIIAPIVKIILGITLVVLGFNVIGVLISILVASLLPTLIGLAIVKRDQKKEAQSKPNSSNFFTEFKRYSMYYFLASMGISVITNADILLVRAFFQPEVSGQYAALSLMGKAIFYFTSPIYFVFFPLIVQKNERKESYSKLLFLTIGIVFSITGAISMFYFIFPQFVLAVFAPRPEYQALIPYIGPFSFYMLVFSVANIFNHLFLSLNKTKVFMINLFIAALFIVSIIYFHNSLQQVITILFISSSLLLFLYVLYYYRVSHGKN